MDPTEGGKAYKQQLKYVSALLCRLVFPEKSLYKMVYYTIMNLISDHIKIRLLE